MGFFQLRQVADYVHRAQPSLHHPKELSSLSSFNMYPSNPVFEMPLPSVLAVLCFLSHFLLFCPFVSASYPHFDSQAFLSPLAWRVTAQ